MRHRHSLPSDSNRRRATQQRQRSTRFLVRLVGRERPKVGVFLPRGPLSEYATRRRRRRSGVSLGWYAHSQRLVHRLGHGRVLRFSRLLQFSFLLFESSYELDDFDSIDF